MDLCGPHHHHHPNWAVTKSPSTYHEQVSQVEPRGQEQARLRLKLGAVQKPCMHLGGIRGGFRREEGGMHLGGGGSRVTASNWAQQYRRWVWV